MTINPYHNFHKISPRAKEMKHENIYKAIERVTHSSIAEYLSAHGVPENTLTTINESSYQLTLEKWSEYTPDFTSAAIGVVRSGLLRSNVESLSGKLRNCSFILPGMIFIGNMPNSNMTNFISLENSVLEIIPGDTIYQEITNSRAFFDIFINKVSHDKSKQRDWAILSNSVDKRDHILLSLYLIFINCKINQKSVIGVRYQDLADMSGVSVPYAIGVIKELISIGAIRKVYGGITLENFNKLEDLINTDLLEEFFDDNAFSELSS